MSATTKAVKKKAVPGSLKPRWTKDRVVLWLEIGAVPAIVGLWFPDWVGSYASGSFLGIPPLPPLLTYIGAVILLKACFEGIKGMGFHFRGLLISGGLTLVSAAASLALQLARHPYASLASTGFAAFFAAGFFWFTIGKIAEITQETRTRVTWHAVWVLSAVSLLVYLFGVHRIAGGDSINGFIILRLGVALFTVVFGFCRYAVHCYKTQGSLGARFNVAPDEQYWSSAG